MNVTLLLSKIGLSPNLSQDVMLVLFIALLSFIYGMVLGKYRVMNILINIYISFAIIQVVPNALIKDDQMKVVVFFVLLVLLTIVSKRFYDISFSGAGSSFLWRIFVVSFLQIVLILSIIFSILPEKEALAYVSPSAFGYLVSGYFPLFWMVFPLIFLFFLCKKGYR
jgi:hypothetical protein